MKSSEFETIRIEFKKHNGWYWYNNKKIIGASLYREGWYIVFLRNRNQYYELVSIMRCPKEIIPNT